MRLLLLTTLVAEGMLMGYVIGKYDLDEKVKRAIAQGATEFIAYAKSVPPREGSYDRQLPA